MENTEKIVYTCFCTDIIHEGHLNIIQECLKLGKVIVGVLADESMVKYNRFPTKSLAERIELIKTIPDISEVIIQHEIMYDTIFETLHPDYVVHGNNWNSESMKMIKRNILNLTHKFGGELVEIPYTANEQVKKMEKQMVEKLSMPEFRRKRLRILLDIVPVVKTIEVHSGLTGLIAEKTMIAENENINQFDAMWISSLCDSTNKGKPDIELVDLTSRFRTISDVMEVTTKPIIFDGDTGGLVEHFVYTVRSLERMGVSAVIIEDKIGLKRNSLFGTEASQQQDTIENFSQKISAGKEAQLSDDFMIIARIESLILEQGIEDALKRASVYVKAGADGIMIHSRKPDPDEVLEFCDKFRQHDPVTPLIVVPSTFNTITEAELAEHGVNIVIYANQLMRAAFPAMKSIAEDFLRFHRAAEVDRKILPIKDIISLIDEL